MSGNNEVKPFVRNYGMVIVDECHHVSSVTFEQVLKQVNAHYVYGLPATPIRKDGHLHGFFRSSVDEGAAFLFGST